MKSMNGPPDANPAPQTVMPSAPPSYSEAVGVSQVQGTSPPIGFYPAQQPASYPMPGYPQYPQQQPFNTTQPPYPQGQSNPTVINVVSPAAATHQTYLNQPQHSPFVSVVRLHPPLSQRHTGIIFTTLGPGPARVKCTHCNHDVLTTTTVGPSGLAHICCFIMFLSAFWVCSCLPYCMSSCEVVTHRCPNCRSIIGKYQETC